MTERYAWMWLRIYQQKDTGKAQPTFIGAGKAQTPSTGVGRHDLWEDLVTSRSAKQLPARPEPWPWLHHEEWPSELWIHCNLREWSLETWRRYRGPLPHCFSSTSRTAGKLHQGRLLQHPTQSNTPTQLFRLCKLQGLLCHQTHSFPLQPQRNSKAQAVTAQSNPREQAKRYLSSALRHRQLLHRVD